MGETLMHSLELLANHFFCNNVATEHTLDSLSFHPMENLLCYMLISYPFVVKKKGGGMFMLFQPYADNNL